MATDIQEFEPGTWLWEPQRRGVEQTIDMLSAGKDVCYYAPTGGGKGSVAGELIRWASEQGIPSAFYVNRRLLVGQAFDRFAGQGLDVGVRAADYEDLDNAVAMVQVCSVNTDYRRVCQRKFWEFHDAGLVLVDELHIMKGQMMDTILKEYRSRGAMVVGFTATPIGISHMVDELVVSGSLKEYRACNALVPAVVKSIEQPDMSKVTRRADGEYAYDGKDGLRFRKRYTQQIVGNVFDRWKRYNPDARPTFLYAPGCAESVWLTQQFEKEGVRWAHIDSGEIYLDGKRYNRSRSLWDDLIEQFKAGDVKGISSRFVLREGVDLPQAYHAILACPMGSMASYIQTVGRILRYSEATPDDVLVTDHGGNYWRHGSPNADRPWHDWWGLDEGQVSRMSERIRKETGGEDEPIRCPNCELEYRIPGRNKECPKCGFVWPKGRREVFQVDGTMKEVDGKLTRKVRTQRRKDTESKWCQLFWAWRHSPNTKDKSIAQLEGFFTHQYGHHPPRDLPYMPIAHRDWYQHVSKVDLGLLRGKG